MYECLFETELLMRQIARRSLLASTISLAAGTAACAQTGASPRLSNASPTTAALNARAQTKGLFFGSAVSNETLTGDPAALARIDAECGMVGGENVFKWGAIHPKADTYDFSGADALMNWAARRSIRVRGHNLVWHEGNPGWLDAELTPANAESLLVKHIQTVVGHFKGRLVQWDVVNEPIDGDDKQPFNLRKSPWLTALGPNYIDIAFQAAAATDPKALRVLNEFGTDYMLPWQERKRGALLDLLSNLTHRNIPVQAVGLQGHLDAGETTLDQKVLSRFVADIASMGLKVIVTELDVRDQRLPADIPSRDTAVAEHARAWLDAVLPNPAVLGVLTWGLSDRHSWLNDKFPRPDKLPQRPLPLDTDLVRKKLWSAIAASFDAAPVRPVLRKS